jgi:hypothetical protein
MHGPDRVARLNHDGPHAPRRTAGCCARLGLLAVSGPWELRAYARLQGVTGCLALLGRRGSREWSEGGARHRSGQADVDVTK